MPKEITLNDLAVMIAKGFEENSREHSEILTVLRSHEFVLKNHEDRVQHLEE